MKKVLCVCLGNTCRSPMMAALLSYELRGVEVESAGLLKEVAGRPATPETLLLMNEFGTDLSTHRSRWIGDLDMNEFSHIVCVGEAERQKVHELLGDTSSIEVLVPNEQGGGIPNPWEKGLDAYRECIQLIEDEMPRVAAIIKG